MEIPFLTVKAEVLLRFLGTGGARTRAWGAIAEAAGRLQERMAPALAVRACLAVVPVQEAENQGVKLAGFHLPCNARFFHGADRAAVVVMTLGEEEQVYSLSISLFIICTASSGLRACLRRPVFINLNISPVSKFRSMTV